MRRQKTFSKFSLRAISAAICISLVSSCAYESYPVSHSPYNNSNHSPYRNTQTVSDPTIPIVLGAAAIGALAYYGKKKHDRRHQTHHYPHRNHYDSSRHRSTCDNPYTPPAHRSRSQHYSSTCHSSHTSRHDNRSHSNNRRISRNTYSNSAREALEKKRDRQRGR